MNIVVLCGGLSPERDVSLSSGLRIASALRSLGHRAALVDMYLGLEGWHGSLDSVFDLPLPDGGYRVAESAPDLAKIQSSRVFQSPILFGEHVLELCRAADLVFLALHGQCGEDGRVQAAFDLLGIPYTGSGAKGSTLAMDKHLTKLIARSAGVLTPDWIFLGPGEPVDAGQFRLPCVIKPVSSGSSLGVEIVRSSEQLLPALRSSQSHGSGVLVEDYIAGREIQISILGGVPLPSIEIRPGSGFYDYVHKYQPGAAEEITPSPISPEAEERIAKAALLVYSELGLKGLVRADFILDGDGNAWFLEINTLPGMTPTSLAPQEAAAAGLSYEGLCARMISLALEEANTCKALPPEI